MKHFLSYPLHFSLLCEDAFQLLSHSSAPTHLLSYADPNNGTYPLSVFANSTSANSTSVETNTSLVMIFFNVSLLSLILIIHFLMTISYFITIFYYFVTNSFFFFFIKYIFLIELVVVEKLMLKVEKKSFFFILRGLIQNKLKYICINYLNIELPINILYYF